jgi:hypothetical protein
MWIKKSYGYVWDYTAKPSQSVKQLMKMMKERRERKLFVPREGGE